MGSRVTVYDIAARLSISPSTVSRVLNNSVLVAGELRTRILATAESMGYRRRRIRRPEGRSILNIGLVLPHRSDASLHLFYDAADLIEGIESGFGGARINIITVLAERVSDLYERKKLGDIDGCIFAFTTPDPDTRARFGAHDIPWVVLNRIEPDGSYVCADNAGGVRMLVSKMLECNATATLCFLGFSQMPEVNDARSRGFRSAAGEAGRPVFDLRAKHRSNTGWFTAGVERIRDIDRILFALFAECRVTGVVCFNDVLAVYLCQIAQECAVRIPEDLMVSGFDDSPARRLSILNIDTVSLLPSALGAEAARRLRLRIVERDDSTIRVLLPGEYIEGDTIRRRA